MQQPRFLMCPPLYFGVEYVINPWMAGQIHATDSKLAHEQWSRLQAALGECAETVLLPPVQGLPDLVFTANAALIYRDVAVLSSFRCPERQPESPHCAEWLRANGFHVHVLPSGVLFEGAGDALLNRGKPLLWLGHGWRSDIEAKPYLEKYTGLETQPLRLQNPSFYHLDTCFCPLEGGYLLYYPAAFDPESNEAIEMRVPPEKRLAVSDADAARFSCNAVNIGSKVILNYASDAVTTWLNDRGFQVLPTELTEFMKSGGAAKCLSLRLNEPG